MPTANDVPAIEDGIDHVRGRAGGRLILVYGDYECPYTRKAFLAIERLEDRLGGDVRFAFRHFPLTEIHPHAFAASAAAEAAGRQGRFWEMSAALFDRQRALDDNDLRDYAAELGLDLATFDRDLTSETVRARVLRDVESGRASGRVRGTPTIFIDGVVHRGPSSARALLEALGTRPA